MSNTIHDAIKLARAFGEEVQSAFEPWEFRAICDANKSEYADSTTCATHDHCDANTLMEIAFTNTFEREPYFLTDESETTRGEADMRLWSEAWAIAKAAEFFA